MDTNDVTRPHTYRHESLVAQIIFTDVHGKETGDLGEEETFVKVDGLWYPERTIKAGAVGYRLEQLQPKYSIFSGLIINPEDRIKRND